MNVGSSGNSYVTFLTYILLMEKPLSLDSLARERLNREFYALIPLIFKNKLRKRPQKGQNEKGNGFQHGFRKI